MVQTGELILRLVLAGVLGGLIGYEREIRAKGAGIRTHFLVALASALFMVVSQWGFAQADKFDASRVAAQVVSGIGFLGAGIIIFQKNNIRGLTTAAGLWVTSAIGLAAASGLYVISAVTTALVLICLEITHFYSVKGGDRIFEVTLSSREESPLSEVVRQLGTHVEHFAFSHEEERFRLDMTLRNPRKQSSSDLMDQLSKFEDVTLDHFE